MRIQDEPEDMADRKKRSQSAHEPPRKRRKSNDDRDDKGSTGPQREVRTLKRTRNPIEAAEVSPSKSEQVNGSHINMEAAGRSGRSGYVRFGSEEPAPLLDEREAEQEADTLSQGAEEDSSDSDDDAPEDITTAAAESSLRAANVQATRAMEEQRKDARKKRQAREWRLQEQARLSQKTKTRIKASELPVLLPDDILEDDSFVRAPTPPPRSKSKPQTEIAPQTKSIKFVDQGPRDVEVGPVKVSVLRQNNRHLAPKANKKTRNVKDQWLAGRRGSGIERRVVGRGFLRK